MGDALFNWFVSNFEHLSLLPAVILLGAGGVGGWFLKSKTVEAEISAFKQRLEAANDKAAAAVLRAENQNAQVANASAALPEPYTPPAPQRATMPTPSPTPPPRLKGTTGALRIIAPENNPQAEKVSRIFGLPGWQIARVIEEPGQAPMGVTVHIDGPGLITSTQRLVIEALRANGLDPEVQPKPYGFAAQYSPLTILSASDLRPMGEQIVVTIR